MNLTGNINQNEIQLILNVTKSSSNVTRQPTKRLSPLVKSQSRDNDSNSPTTPGSTEKKTAADSSNS